MNIGFGDDHSTVAVANEDARPGTVEYRSRRGHICLEGGLGLLDDEDRVQVMRFCAACPG
jgi:hypothetical protein